MAAAVKTGTLVGTVAPHVQTTGKGIKSGSYTVTIATQNDWVVFSDFDTVTNVWAETVATGVANPCTIGTGADSNKVVFTSATTGATRVIVWGY